MHNIEYYTYFENVNRDYVQKELDHHAAVAGWQEGCTGLGKNIRWLEKAGVCADYETAQKVIEANDQGRYDQLAVRFNQPKRGLKSKKLDELKEKEKAALGAYNAMNEVWAKGLKAEFVGCRHCGSKMRRTLIKSNKCPVCYEDLRPESSIKALGNALHKYKKAQAARNSYECDHSEKEVKWLVKIEYHT